MDGVSVSAFTAAAAGLRRGAHTIASATVQKERSLIKCERSVCGMRTQSLPVWFYAALKSAPRTQKQVRAPQRRFQENPGWNLEPLMSVTSIATQKSLLVFILLLQRTETEVRPNWPSRRTSGLLLQPPTRARLLRKSLDQTSRGRTDGPGEPPCTRADTFCIMPQPSADLWRAEGSQHTHGAVVLSPGSLVGHVGRPRVSPYTPTCAQRPRPQMHL